MSLKVGFEISEMPDKADFVNAGNRLWGILTGLAPQLDWLY